MVTRFLSISTRKLPKAIDIMSANKCFVALSDYNEFHKMAKRHLHTSVLGPSAQKRYRGHRDTLIENISSQINAHVEDSALEAFNFRAIFDSELFGLAMKVAVGKDVESIYVDGLGTTVRKNEILAVLVYDPMEAAILVDWRALFPWLKWVPNKSLESNINRVNNRNCKQEVMKSIIKEQTKRISLGEEMNCYLDYLSSEGKTLSDNQKASLIWEVILETTDTTLITTEWAMYELSKDPKRQDRLYREIRNVCGSEKITEEKLGELPYLMAVFHETLRKHNPVALLAPRYVHEDTELGGYHVPAGLEIAINLYGCNMDEKLWENPEEWNLERFLDKKYDPNNLFKTMAFGGGKRVCAGALQASLIACTLIARLVQVRVET